MAKGTIGVTTENIFPVIKKFLYSDHEIFIRELVANAVDATQKLNTIANSGEFKGELGDLTIRLTWIPRRCIENHRPRYRYDSGRGGQIYQSDRIFQRRRIPRKI